MSVLSTALSIFAAVFKYLPYVLQGIKDVEAAIGPGNGATKKAIILGAIQAGAVDGEAVPETHVAAVSKLIDSTVTALNASGLLGSPAPVK